MSYTLFLKLNKNTKLKLNSPVYFEKKISESELRDRMINYAHLPATSAQQSSPLWNVEPLQLLMPQTSPGAQSLFESQSPSFSPHIPLAQQELSPSQSYKYA